ncbi:hypothetical protein KRR40_29235 [Niabella defluvii]|nr:hypothetical protein KRR40_29235 [Niabella sp. I65]
MEEFKEKVRKKIIEKYPEVAFNFEPMELTEKIMGQGAMTPIEVKVGANQIKGAFAHASKIEANLKKFHICVMCVLPNLLPIRQWKST